MKGFIRLLIFFSILAALRSCSPAAFDKRKMANKALDYFTNKYNINKKDIKIEHNTLYSNSKYVLCVAVCPENEMSIYYKDKEYKIEYYLKEKYFADDYQYEQIYNDLLKHLQTKFSYISDIKIDFLNLDVIKTPDKYNGNIESYFKNIKKSVYDDGTRVGNTSIDIWIEAKDEIEAKELKQKYIKELVTELENLEVKYEIAISSINKISKYSSFYFYQAYESYFYSTDKVDKNEHSCKRSNLEYEKCY